MTIDTLYAALGLPPEVVDGKRVPKTALLEHVALTAADRRLVQTGLEELRWLATLKPHLCGVAAYYRPTSAATEAADDPDIEEVVVLGVRLRTPPGPPTTRLLELLHRAVPYPVLLLAESAADPAGGVVVSLAHKRPAQNAADRLTLLEVRHSEPLHLAPPLARAAEPTAEYQLPGTPVAPPPPEAAYLAALTLPAVAPPDLRALYQSWLDRTVALAAAQLTGRYCPPATAAQATALRAALARHGQLRAEQATVRAQAGREKQLARRAAANLRLRQLEAELTAVLSQLTFTA